MSGLNGCSNRRICGGFDHARQSSIIERLTDPGLQMFPTFDNSHRLRVCNLTGFIGDIHALIEFVPQSSGPIESIDQLDVLLSFALTISLAAASPA
jgi:hypothetical protein